MTHRVHTCDARTFSRALMSGAAAAALLFASVSTAPAAGTPEEACQRGRYAAAAKYDACMKREMSVFMGGSSGTFETGLSRCRVKYAAAWAKLRAKASGSGSTCDNPRYEDDGDGTVTDRLTGLQWEQKTADATVHDKDNGYAWSAGGGGSADGSAYTGFLATLNGGGCFAGECDWRLPTLYELETIVLEPYPCATSPCIDESTFGPTATGFHWSATSYAAEPANAWIVEFGAGVVFNGDKAANTFPVRAVRAGL